MSERPYPIWKRLLILPVIAAGIAAIVIAVNLKSGPKQEALEESSARVRVITVPSVELVPRALGYGYVEPGKVWEAVAEVKGRIVEMNEQLKKGALITQGAMLLRIDPADYHLAVAQIDANIRAVDAQLVELDSKRRNNELSIAIEQKALDLNLKDLERKQKLLAARTVSEATVDQEERNVLTRRLSVQNIRNALNLIPAERQVLDAQRALYEAQLKSANHDLDRTTILAPFDCRIAEVNIEEAQYAAQGKVLVVADSIDMAEITAQIPLEKLVPLIPQSDRSPFDGTHSAPDVASFVNLDAVVRLTSGEVVIEWDARFERLSDTVDPKTRTVGVIVAVDQPYHQARPGIRPPLTKNMFVEVELRGTPRPNRIIVPRAALHGDRLYVANKDDRLEIRKASIDFTQSNFAVIGSGIEAGERLIVTDLIPAIEGMLLKPTPDDEVASRIRAEAEGRGAVR